MPSTSLAEQLKKLSVPQSSIYKEDIKKASLLFDPKEASHKDRDTFYEIGLSGLHELISLYEGFRFYEDSLFSVSSKEFERAVQSKEVNKNLDETIEKFLLQLSPYLLLQSAHKALEWLVNRYHIHQYNQDAIVGLILPYHETKIFVRFIQLLDLKSSSNRWNWLKPIQQPGVPLTKQVLYNQCVSNTSTLQFISKSTLKYVKELGDQASQLNTVYAFFCSTAVGTINTAKRVTESMVIALLPTLMQALESPIIDFRSAAYVVVGYLSTKTVLKANTFNDIIERILTTEYDLSYDMTLLINLMYTNHPSMNTIPDAILHNISSNLMTTLCEYMKKLVDAKINIQLFVLAFLSSVLALVRSDNENLIMYGQLLVILIDEVDLKRQNPVKVIKCILDSITSDDTTKSSVGDDDDDGSDIEIIDESGFSTKLLDWYSVLLKSVELKYPGEFDKVIKQEMSSGSAKNKAQLSKVLGFKPAVAHKIGGAYLFENLNHVNPKLRAEAVNYISKEFKALKVENNEFVRESIISRFQDDNVEVVTAALAIPVELLQEVLTEEDITDAFVQIVSKNSHKWKPVIKVAIVKFCSLNTLPVNHKTVIGLVPHLFPSDDESADIAGKIITSPWGKKFELTKHITEKNLKSPELILKVMYQMLFKDRSITFDNVLDINQLNKNSGIDIYIFLLLKSSSYKKATVNEIIEVLNLLLDSVESREILRSSVDQTFTKNCLPEFVRLSQKNKIVFEVMEFILQTIIEDMNVGDLSKPWFNMCSKPETILVRRLYEICVTGCSIKSYGESYSKLLQKLLKKFCQNTKEKFEFIANFACGHIIYATDPKDVISPELQLRSIKLLESFINTQTFDKKWMYESDVFILMILFNLNNPLSIVRQCAINLVVETLKVVPGLNQVYLLLLKEIMNHKEEVLLDHEQIPQVHSTILTRSNPVQKVFRKNCTHKLLGILTSDTESHISCELLRIFRINNAQVFASIVPSLKPLEIILQKNVLNQKLTFDIYESKLFMNVYGRIDVHTVAAFEQDHVWRSIEFGLKEYRECILEDGQTFVSPAVLIMKQIDEDVFEKVSEERSKQLVHLITSAGTFSNNPITASAAFKVIKKIHLTFKDIKPILEQMLNVQDPAANNSKKKKSSVSMLSYQLADCEEWKLGVTILEYVQNKKKMDVDNSFVSVLFQILKKCLRFEEQSHVEYTKQLILSSLWYYCKKFVNEKDNDKDQLNSLKSLFDIELVVQCIRGTQNPQTHHHALILLSHAAFMLPEQVLHHTMEIFTFMGSSVLRHDDAYSFQIIVKIIETLIPILVKLDKPIEELKEKELKQLQGRVVPVLRIFADVVLHVPEHRRLPLYKKLLETLGANQFLWVFLALLLDAHIVHFNDSKEKDQHQPKTLADKESPINRLDFGQSILLEFPPEVCMESFVKFIVYLKSLPLQKDDNAMETNIDPVEIFSVNGHTAIQLRHFKYVIITFMNTCLASSRFIQHTSQAKDVKAMEEHYKTFIINILTFVQAISKVSDEKTAKYWRVMLHRTYDLLDNTNNLLSALMFLSVIKGLLKHTLQTVRRKAMELLNSKIQFSPEMFKDVDKEHLYALLPGLLDIVKTLENKDDSLNEITAQELEMNQQTALLALKLLTRMLSTDNPEPFKPVLETVTEYTCNPNISGNVMASIVLCLAELCGNLKAHALPSLRKFMPALIKVLKKQRIAETPELVLLSTVTAISKIVESLPLFLSPYLQKILYEYSILLAKWQSYDQENSKVSAIVAKLTTIKKKIAGSIPPRVLIPVANETYRMLLEKESFEAIGPVMSVLADSFANVTNADFKALQQDLTTFFLSALQLRSDAGEKNISDEVIDKAEDEVVNALVSLVLKLSETSFRPFYFKIYDWAIRTNVDGHKDRAITFYRLSSAIANKLKGLFVLFAGHFIKNAADLLDACNSSKSEEHYFDSDTKCIALVNYIIKTLHIVFLYDSQNFLNKDRFETLMQPVVDQLENTIGGIENLKLRATESLVPCISQFAVSVADDSLWKLLNYQILLKTRHNDGEIRLVALECLVAMATQLGSGWLPLLAESVPFLAELLEDGDAKIESSTKEAIRKLEQILGEPLEKYF